MLIEAWIEFSDLFFTFRSLKLFIEAEVKGLDLSFAVIQIVIGDVLSHNHDQVQERANVVHHDHSRQTATQRN